MDFVFHSVNISGNSVASKYKTVEEIYPKIYAIRLTALWLRFMRCCRAFQNLGLFIEILGNATLDQGKKFLLKGS